MIDLILEQCLHIIGNEILSILCNKYLKAKAGDELYVLGMRSDKGRTFIVGCGEGVGLSIQLFLFSRLTPSPDCRDWFPMTDLILEQCLHISGDGILSISCDKCVQG